MNYGELEDELEPVDDERALVMDAEAMCEDIAWQRECVLRVPEIDDIEEDEYHRWCSWIEELDGMDGDALAADLEECQEYMAGVRWIEDAYGGAVYVEP